MSEAREKVGARAVEAFVFDMDGLMVDTEPMARDIWDQVLDHYGFQLDDATHRRMVGRRSADSARIVLEQYPLGVTAEALIVYKNNLWEQKWRQGVPAMPGLSAVQEALERRGIPWAVATSSPRHYAEHVVQHLGCAALCRAIAAGDEVEHGKPAPDLYLLAARRLGIAPERCLALEDSLPGGQAAKAAGMTLVAIPNGTATAHDFAFADYIFSSLVEVVTHLDELLAQPDSAT
ncbi:MAG: HAD family phosphatase [Candidatus Promineifilaceae bacterium]|nr:HAD family phosphatase [Candidatus Promineifilaceae bacterium]